ncbi:hypothetical protein FALBO_4952 [Fusarium albosuccineum]|uniref:Uncharacterized protein n=1 Tax=Fusarium albosuccineum TaxID=1237068 RepID=A0A8H4PEQ1_9HYPO|nr:hypothetical protein FALBO_4952 [Fusarium albosuccineum]
MMKMKCQLLAASPRSTIDDGCLDKLTTPRSEKLEGRNEEQSITNFHQEVDKAADEAFQQKENATCHADKLSAGLEDLRRLVKDRGDTLPASLRDVVSEAEGNFNNATLAVGKAEQACKEGTRETRTFELSSAPSTGSARHLLTSPQSYAMEKEFSGQRQTKRYIAGSTAAQKSLIAATENPRSSDRPSQVELRLPARKWKRCDAVEAMLTFRAACDERTEAEHSAARLRTEYTGAVDFMKHWVRLCANLLSYGEEVAAFPEDITECFESLVNANRLLWLYRMSSGQQQQDKFRRTRRGRSRTCTIYHIPVLEAIPTTDRRVEPRVFVLTVVDFLVHNKGAPEDLEIVEKSQLSETLDHVFCKARDIIGISSETSTVCVVSTAGPLGNNIMLQHLSKLHRNDDGTYAASQERLAENAADRKGFGF